MTSLHQQIKKTKKNKKHVHDEEEERTNE